MEENSNIKLRNLRYTDEFNEFYSVLDERSKNKFGYCLDLLRNKYVLSSKFIKQIVSSDNNLYEPRVSVGFNEYRSIIFSADHSNIIQATEIIILNGFLKKSSKDYDRQIHKAINILNNIKL